MQAQSENSINSETRMFWSIVSELRQENTDNLSDAAVLSLLDELEVMALNTDSPALAARCRAKIASFGEEAAALKAAALKATAPGAAPATAPAASA